MPVCAVPRPHGSPHCCQRKTCDHELGSEIQQPVAYQNVSGWIHNFSQQQWLYIIIVFDNNIIILVNIPIITSSIAPREVITNLRVCEYK